MDFKQLRVQYPEFIYKNFNILYEGEDLKIQFEFETSPDIQFNPEVTFPNISKQRLEQIGEEQLNNLVFNLGMVELLSYWKATCSPKIVIKTGILDDQQLGFWHNLLLQGMGEFFYQNQIDFTEDVFVQFVIARSVTTKQSNENNTTEIASATPRNDVRLKDRSMVLVGGGKDSAVTLDLLKDKNINALMLNPTQAAVDITKAANIKDPIIIKRTIDPKLLELNKQGFLNGHTPFSAYLAFLGTLVGVLYDYKNIVVSNEASSNEGNVEWQGMEINHQYSKTFEFETLFRNYSSKYLSVFSDYFSFLRPLNELQISKLFAGMEKYHNLFRSCNVGSKSGIWCGECPKCVSTYLTLFPFLGEKLHDIFGKDLFENAKLIPIVQGLMRLNDVVKPFECVCSVDEIKYAIFLSIKKYQGNLPVVLDALKDQAEDLPELLENWNDENYLTEDYHKILKVRILAS